MSFETAHEFVAKWEGGFVDDALDPGGVTKWGVTIRTLIAKGLDLNGDGAINRKDIRDMTPEQAIRIYRRDYWVGAACPSLPNALALVHYDSAVNQGVGRAARILQKTVGAKADGRIGRKTIAAMNLAWGNPETVLRDYCARRALHYSSLSIIVRFGLGWFRRLFAVQSAALSVLKGDCKC